MREAAYFKPLTGGTVQCELCPHRCRITPGHRGICGVRENQEGRLVSLVFGKSAASHIDPVEKKPLFHFLPGSTTFSIATVGCNLSCPFCQNHDLSLAWRGRDRLAGFEASPETVVRDALASGCQSISFTYSEPTIFFEYMLEIARLARQEGLKTIIVSNGFIEPAPLRELAEFLDAANIDLKAFRETTYRKILKAALQPVLDTITALPGLGVWTEVTTLVIPGLNDSDQELADIAGFLAGCSTDMPWHISRFYPQHEWADRAPTPVSTLRRALEAGRRAGLKYNYPGNVPGEPGESTFCPGCGKLVIERSGFRVGRMDLTAGGHCAHCGYAVAGVFEAI